MNKMYSSYTFLCLLFIIVNYSKGLSLNLKQGETCSSGCSGNSKIFKYEENQIYVYDFLSRHSIKNPNSEKETLQLELKGKAAISKVTACDFSLQLSDINLKEFLSDKSEDSKEYSMMKNMLEKYSIRFGFDDGRVSGVCQDNQDDEFSVNVKKAIISSLQVSIDSLEGPNYLTETDISGECITEYTTAPEPPNFVIVKKTKSISGCARKQKYFSTFSGRNFEQPMEGRNFALLDGSYECDIKIKISEGLKESICKETQTFKPFDTTKSGASLEITQELKFNSIKTGKISSQTPTTRSDLIMNHGDRSPLIMKKKKTSLLDIGKKLCINIKKNSITSERTKLFVKLIRSLSSSDYLSIKKLNKYFMENEDCTSNKKKLKNLLLDALSQTKSDDAFKFLLESSGKNEVKSLSFTILENASPKMIELFTKKLDDSKIHNSALISLSTMIRSFCDRTPGCMLNPDIINAMNRLLKNLGNNCNADKSSTEKILFTLRAIGNVGDFPDYKSLIQILESCVNSASNDNDVKALSLAAVQHFPCHADIDKFIWSAYDEARFSTEIRVQAYLSLIRCPFRETFRKIIQKLDNEKSQQLGSFVWSHILNLMETSDRFKTDLREMLQIFTKPLNDLSNKFNLDFRSYSKNIEKTFRKGQSSVKIDSNIIFASSAIPRYISANVTADIFGRSLNIFEIGIGIKGLDRIFGNSILEPHKDQHPDVVKMQKKNGKNREKSSVSLFTKFMGREVHFTPNLLSDITNAALKMSTKESFEKSLLLLDLTVSISTITGFPIEVSVESAASADLQMSRNKHMQLKDIELSLKNNMAIQIIGKLQVNAHCAKIGVQTLGTISSNSEFGGKFKFINSKKSSSQLTDYQFEINNMPDDRKLLEISNELSLIHGLKKVEAKPQYETLLEKCTGNAMFELRGIRACVTASSAKSFHSFFPNIMADITIKKFNGFRFQLRKESVLKPVTKLVSFLLSTSFDGEDKETLRFHFDRNINQQTQVYELALWKNDIHFKVDINKKKISGKFKYGENEATLTGEIENIRFLKKIKMNIITKSDEIFLKFDQQFTKDGPFISLSAKKKGDKEFDFYSTTSLKISEHKIFNYFQRFRHSTRLKSSGANEFLFVVESSKGNKPTNEIKAKLETYWKTKSINNFFIKQNIGWSKYSVMDKSVEFETIPGTNYSLILDQKIEVREKKFNLKHNANFFISNDFSIFAHKPSLVILKLETFDLIEKKSLRKIDSKFFIDVMNAGKGKIIFKHYFKHHLLKLYQNLHALASWKRNSLDMYDIEAQITDNKFFTTSLKHHFTTTQNGVSSLEMKINELIYKIDSELSLPKNHKLTVSWPKNSFKIESNIETKTLSPFETVINHDVTLNEKLLVSITNFAQYDNEKNRIFFESVGKQSEKLLYKTHWESGLKYNLGSEKWFYNFTTNFQLEIPSESVDFLIESKQFANIIRDGEINMDGKNFESSFIYLNNKENLKYGYKTVSEVVGEKELVKQIKYKFYKGSSKDKLTLKFKGDDSKRIYGLFFNSDDIGNFEIFYKLKMEKEKINSSFLVLFEMKKNDKKNFYYKSNLIILHKLKEMFSVTWNGEWGKSKTSKLTPFQGVFKLHYTGAEKVDLNLKLSHPILSIFKIANVVLGFNYELIKSSDKSATINSNALVKWQKESSRTSNYYELKLKGGYDFIVINKISTFLKGELFKDSSKEKLLDLELLYKEITSNFETKFKVKSGAKHASFNFNINRNKDGIEAYDFSIKTSLDILKEFSLLLELKRIGTTQHGKFIGNLISKRSYNLQITRVWKIDKNMGLDLVANTKWVSNIPYVNSGSEVFGLLSSKSGNFKISYSLIYKNAKKLNLKFSSDKKSNEVQVFAESFFVIPLKLVLHSTMMSSNMISLNFECGYKEHFLKITDTKFSWNNEGKLKSTEFTMTILSSNEVYNDIIITISNSFEKDNLIRTLTSEAVIKYKGKIIHFEKFDLKKREIKFDSTLGQYMKLWNIKKLNIDIKYEFKAITDMSLKYSFLAEPVFPKSELEIVYFRKTKDEATKQFGTFGEAAHYSQLSYNYGKNYFKKIIFVNDKVDKGNFIFGIYFPKTDDININVDEMSVDFSLIKESEERYKGKATFKNHQYEFEFQSPGKYKKSLEIKAISIDTTPSKVSASFDFQDDSYLRIYIDKIMNLDLKMESQSSNKKLITILASAHEKEIINLKINSDSKFPKDTSTLIDYLKAVIGVKTGAHIKWDISGVVFRVNIKRKTEIYHIKSLQFEDGTKHFFSVNSEIKFSKNIISRFKFSLDRNFPLVDYENAFYLKIDDDLQLNKEAQIKIVSKDNFKVYTKNYFKDKYDFKLNIVNNQSLVQTDLLYEIPKIVQKTSSGSLYMKESHEFVYYFKKAEKDYSLKTNFVKAIFNTITDKALMIGNEYYFTFSKTYEIKVLRTKPNECKISINYNWSEPIKVTIVLIEERANGVFGLNVKGTTPFEKVKMFFGKCLIEYNDKLNKYKFSTSLNQNRKLVSDLELKFKKSNEKMPHQLQIDYKGTYIIKGLVKLSTEERFLSYSIVVKDGTYKTNLWTSDSECRVKLGFKFYFNHKNKAREMIYRINWEDNYKNFELTWNKKKGQSLIVSVEKEGAKKTWKLQSPLKILTVSHTKMKTGDTRNGHLVVDIKDFNKSPNDINLSLQYEMKGSLNNDYALKVNLKTTLMQKEITLFVQRSVSLEVGDLYVVDVKAFFDEEKLPFFGMSGRLTQLSTRSYEMKLHGTNYKRFVTITTTAIFAAEELTLEYKLIQTDQPEKKFLFQYIPFKKLLITNNNNFKIFLKKNIYQFGYKNEYIFKMSPDSFNVSGYSTYTKSPMKYYAEVNAFNEKMVVHIRPVGKMIIGEVFRRIADRRVLDASLKLHVDDKNILVSKLFWHPDTFERSKKLLDSIFDPENVKTLMVYLYENSENLLSDFWSSVKMDVIKNLNTGISLEFMKGIANAWEKLPKSVVISYENDDYYVKSFMESISKSITKLDIPSKFFNLQTSVKEFKEAVSQTLYEWIIEAKLYSTIYKPFKNYINSLSYDKLKDDIGKLVDLGKFTFALIKKIADQIANALDHISEKIRSALNLSKNVREGLKFYFKNPILDKFCTILSEIKTEIFNGLEKLLSTDILKQRVAQYQNAIENTKEIISILKDLKNITLQYFKKSNAISDILETFKLIRSLKYKEAFLNSIKLDETKFKMNLNEASMEFQCYISPISKITFKTWKSFLKLFSSKRIYQLYKTSFGEKLLEWFYRYEYLIFNYGSLNFNTFRKLLPPFAKSAWVLNGESLLTFDGSAIRIGPSSCSYLLARDFRKESFSIVMKIDSMNKLKEFELSYFKKVTIQENGMVKVDGQYVNILPKQFKDIKKRFTIYRNDDFIKVATSDGVIMKYFQKLDSLKIKLNGTWHGHVRGLLGSNDFDTGNDWSTPSGLNTHDAGILSKSWSIDKCESKTKTKLHTIRVSSTKLQECANLFNIDSMSYLKRCYSLINPEPYFQLCTRSLQYSLSDKKFKELLCNLSRNYVMQCKYKGLLIRLDRNCVKCEKSKLDSKISLINLSKELKLNYIFIMEQSKCLLPYKNLIGNLVNIMGIKSANMFTLLSYNGNEFLKDIHFKTINNKINTNKDEFNQLLEEFWLSENLASDQSDQTSNQPAKAIYDAIKMSSRSGYTEKIILVSCSACVKNQKYIYSLLAGLLNNAGISVTYFTTQSFTGSELDPNTVGLGNKQVYYFEKDTNNLKFRSWKKNVQAPRDACSPLARMKDGFVWSLKALNNDMKMRRLAETINSEMEKKRDPLLQTCFCTAGNFDEGSIECKVPTSRFYSLLF